MSRLLLAGAILAVSFAAQAQTTRKLSPGELAAIARVKGGKARGLPAPGEGKEARFHRAAQIRQGMRQALKRSSRGQRI